MANAINFRFCVDVTNKYNVMFMIFTTMVCKSLLLHWNKIQWDGFLNILSSKCDHVELKIPTTSRTIHVFANVTNVFANLTNVFFCSTSLKYKRRLFFLSFVVTTGANSGPKNGGSSPPVTQEKSCAGHIFFLRDDKFLEKTWFFSDYIKYSHSFYDN